MFKRHLVEMVRWGEAADGAVVEERAGAGGAGVFFAGAGEGKDCRGGAAGVFGEVDECRCAGGWVCGSGDAVGGDSADLWGAAGAGRARGVSGAV